MNSWSELLNESQRQITPANPNAGVQFLASRKKELIRELPLKTGRNTILYFPAFMYKPSTAAA